MGGFDDENAQLLSFALETSVLEAEVSSEVNEGDESRASSSVVILGSSMVLIAVTTLLF
jgi:hypothetical protein